MARSAEVAFERRNALTSPPRDAHNRMTLYARLVFALWLALIVYWARSAAALTRCPGSRWVWWREVAVRLGFFAFVVLALQLAAAAHALPNAALYTLDAGRLAGFVGLALCAAGIGLAILARAYLDRSRQMSGPDAMEHALVTTGPYARIRHPLYSGLLLAMLGSAIAQSSLWLLPLIVYGPLFILSARREERLLLGHFSERYGAYRRRTKMLLPFLF
jgi:protein-S-isoprenylcysteine O-methyltransferase Ste14